MRLRGEAFSKTAAKAAQQRVWLRIFIDMEGKQK